MSSTWIEKTWIDRISVHLDRFKWIQPNVANFRCNLCGDSDISQKKARGHFYMKDGRYSFKCHNCGEAFKFTTYLNKMFPHEYQEFRLEILKSKAGGGLIGDLPVTPKESAKEEVQLLANKTIMLDELPEDHPAVQYCYGRAIPKNKLYRIGYTDNFQQWVVDNTKGKKQKYRRLPRDKRILFIIKKGDRIIGVQGRSITNSSLRYITLKFNERESKVYGRDFVDMSKPIFVVEGVLDSFFLPNCIALCGGDVGDSLKEFHGCDLIIALDNEPRSKDTITRMKKTIDLGFKVVIWEGIDSKYKDLNDMVLKGRMKTRDILTHIIHNNFKGAAAYLALSQWQKVGPIKY